MVTDEEKIPESEIDGFVRRELDRWQLGAHSYDHTRRVMRLSKEMGKPLGANMRVLVAASLLHDIGRPREAATGISHSILSGEMSRDLLSRLDYSPQEIDHVLSCIRTHRFSEGLRPTSLEGEILSDADKIDAIGAIGIYRAVAESSMNGRGIKGFLDHAEEKLLKLKDMMYTEIGRQIAGERHRLLQQYVEALRAELDD
ncbi:MAG: HD domain-containing protein [Candidatus Thorarchaeota archaeon]